MSSAAAGAPTEGHRTLADQLRQWPEAELATLFTLRPDLISPAPQDSAQVAARAATRNSLIRAMDDLNRLELATLDALVVAVHSDVAELVTMVNAEPSKVEQALTALARRLLIWRSTSGWRPLSGVAEVIRGRPEAGHSGLQPRSESPRSDTAIKQSMAALTPEATALLRHLCDHGGEGTTASARIPSSAAEATTPIEALVAHGLIQLRGEGRGSRSVILPGEVGLVLRDGHTTVDRCDLPPELALTDRDQSVVDRAAAGAAFDAVRRIELLCELWGQQPPAVLRSGGLGVRDLKTLAQALGVDPSEASLLVELAHQAGLVADGLAATGPNEGDVCWIPTDRFDAWLDEPPAQRWVQLARTWLETDRVPGLIGRRDRAGKAVNPLTESATSVLAAQTRRRLLTVLAEAGPGHALATGTGVASLAARLQWLRPRRPPLVNDLVAWSVTEAGALGLIGLGGVATATSQLLADDAAAADTLATLLPASVDHLLIQADLTAVAPGPLTSELARSVQLLADVESRGAAAVYRFTKDSIRRAFDAGWSTAEVHAFIADVSRTEVPQPLRYLVDDVARTFGTVRMGYAEAFLRSDDEAALTHLMHAPAASSLGLRRIAPTVVISTTPADVLLPRLRELGLAPVLEAIDGTVRVARSDQQRLRSPRTKSAGLLAARDEARLLAGVQAAVQSVRSGDRAIAASASRPIATTPQGALTALRGAIEARTAVLISYVDNHGQNSERVVEPQRVEGGQLTARDQRTDQLRTFAIHRITSVRPAHD